MNKKHVAGLAFLALSQTVAAQAAETEKCLSVGQAEALVTYLLPTAVQASRSKCAASLPATATLLKENSAQLAKYRTASEGAWPKAKAAVTALAGAQLPPDMDDSILRPIADALLTSLVDQQIKTRDCRLIAKIYQDIEPMPSANLASLTISIVQATRKDEGKQQIPICKAPA